MKALLRQLQQRSSTTTRSISYDYDGLQRLVSATESPGTTQTYAYDLAGNRTGVWVNGTQTQSLSYNAANQVDGWSYEAVGKGAARCALPMARLTPAMTRSTAC